MNREKHGDRGYTAEPAGMEAGKKAEEPLGLIAPAMAEHWYRVVIDNMNEAAVVVGGDGAIVYGNARFAEMLGLTPERIAGCSMTQFLSEQECGRFESMFLADRQGSAKGEFVLMTSDGRSVPVQVSGKRVNTGEAQALCLIISDISLRKRAEEALRNSHEELEKRVEARTEELTAINEQLKREARERMQAEQGLRESEEHFRLLIENALDIVMVLKDDCTVVYAGPSLRRILGYTTREFVDRSFLDFVETNDREKVRERIMQAARIPGSTVSLEARVRDKNGHWRTIEMISRNLLHDSKVVGIVVNGRDISERKQMEEKLQRAHDELEARVEERTSELRSAYERLEVEIREHKEAEAERARLATAIEQGGDCVIITDRQGIIQYVNPAFERTSLYSREEMTGADFNSLGEGTKDRAFWDEMWETLHAGNVWTGRITNRKKDGTVYEVERSVSPIRDNVGNITNYVAVERDMTEQAGLEAELRQAQKMQAIGTLAGGIAHDFNNILAAILGYTELASLDLPEDSRVQHNLQQSIKASLRARDLVRQILTFSRQGARERRLLNIAPIVQEGLKLLRALLPATIEIRGRTEGDLGAVEADPTQIHQMLMNLCTNAAQAMGEDGGILEVSLNRVDLNGESSADYPGITPGPYLRLRVSDTGHGMTPEVLKRISEPYFTTKEVGKGTGLGLSVVHGIVESHGGGIAVSSEPGKGTTFDILLPRIDTDKIPSKPDRSGPPPLGRHERVLFVDDETHLAEIARSMLDRLGYETVVKTSSLEALELFQARPDYFDLVITDVTMPGLSGDRLAKELLRIRPDIPIILCTGFSEHISEEKAKAWGIRELVMKPLGMEDLAKVIQQALGRPPG